MFKVGEGQDGQKVKISVAERIECSCTKDKDERCLHVIFALVKVYKVPCTSELLWQQTFSDQQVNYILEGRFKR